MVWVGRFSVVVDRCRCCEFSVVVSIGFVMCVLGVCFVLVCLLLGFGVYMGQCVCVCCCSFVCLLICVGVFVDLRWCVC